MPGDSVGRPVPPAGTWEVGLRGCGSLEQSSSLAVHLICPGCSMGQQQPTGHLQPLWAGKVLANTKQKTQKMSSACLQRSVPHTKCAGPAAPLSFSGASCVTAGCASLASFPTILWLLSGKKQLRANIFFLAGAAVRGNSAVKWGMLLFCRHVWQLTSWLGKSGTAQSVPGKGGSWETSGSSKLKISVQAMP